MHRRRGSKLQYFGDASANNLGKQKHSIAEIVVAGDVC
jgi:hypothetical protein